MAEQEKLNPNSIIRDPTLIKNRVFIGNLPLCTREELESICHPYGKVLGSLVQKNFGFVQFESEDIANKAASALHKSTFKGNTVAVRNAGYKPTNPPKKKNQIAEVPQPGNHYNDCEIVVVNRVNTKYAEYIENCLKHCGLRVDVLFPNEDVPLGKILANISSRGCLYAILVTVQHEEHRSITVNILYGVPAEHRNMPLEDAIKLIGEDFRLKMQRDNTQIQLPMLTHTDNKAGAGGFNVPPLNERHPEQVQKLLSALANNHTLTVSNYDRIIKYLQERRLMQVKLESGNVETKVPDPEIELQKQILNILKKPSVTELNYDLMYPDLEAAKQDSDLMKLLHDERVLKAIDELYNSELLKTVGDFFN